MLPTKAPTKSPVAELLEVEIVVRCGAPEPQGVDGLAAEADDRPVVWDADQRRGTVRDDPQGALMQLEASSQA